MTQAEIINPEASQGMFISAVAAKIPNITYHSPVPVGFLEYNTKTWSERGRQQSWALSKLPGVILVGGPT